MSRVYMNAIAWKLPSGIRVRAFSDLSRRGFGLKLGFGAAFAALPVVAQSLSPPKPPDDNDARSRLRSPFRAVTQCTLISRSGSTLYCSENGMPQTVFVSQKVSVWKGSDFDSVSILEPGDIIDARLEPYGSIYVATQIWANLVKIEGIIGGLAAGWIEMFPFEPRTAETTSRIPIMMKFDESTQIPPGISAKDLRTGRAAIIIGHRKKDGSIQATRIILGRP